ncbi:MAG TPA: WecB/TagA/CpsF family glycosyltransferase [Terracidiphilus sp.]|nr:WecB/TagA/CpsF family glycosyltransferase [Terracidiphilus sp.]
MTPQIQYASNFALHAQERAEEYAGSARPANRAALTRARQPHANVLGIEVEAIDMDRALDRIEHALAAREKGWVCMAGVHGIMEAQRDPALRYAYADAAMTLPDGMPTVWVGRRQRFKKMQRVAGPDLILEVFGRRRFAHYTHFLYGGKPGVAEELANNFAQRFPWAHVVGTYTPPFRDLSTEEERALITRLGFLRPSIVWVGISTPRQEKFMRKYSPLLDTTLMFGVGAAFDYHTGRIKDSAQWVKRAGLQWLHRLVQDPGHLWWRYLRNNPAFMCKIALQLSGLKSYSGAERGDPHELLRGSAATLYPESNSG